MKKTICQIMNSSRDKTKICDVNSLLDSHSKKNQFLFFLRESAEDTSIPFAKALFDKSIVPLV